MDRPHMSRVSETATLPFYEGAFVQASPEIERIRKDLPNFSSPELRVQRVGQLDSHLLDQELADLLTQPVKNALRKVSPKFEQRYNSEILVALHLILYKFSIYDRGATYGAMLQNLKYRNEWAHRAHCKYRENLTDFFFYSTLNGSGCATIFRSTCPASVAHDYFAIYVQQSQIVHVKPPVRSRANRESAIYCIFAVRALAKVVELDWFGQFQSLSLEWQIPYRG